MQTIIGSNKFSREFITANANFNSNDSFIPHAE